MAPGEAFRLAVSWSATDNKSGVRDYSVEYKDGSGGSWTAWLTNVTSTQAAFNSRPGHTISFRVTATDRADNAGSVESSGAPAGELQLAKYYLFGGQPVALRKGTGGSSTVAYLYGDHLGSVTVV